MTIQKMLEMKYSELQGLHNPVWWDNAKYYAGAQGITLEKYCYLSLEITVKDIKANGGYSGELWQEISEAHKNKLIASNEHRNYSGKITKYWLTKKGYKVFIEGGAKQ